MATFCRDLCAGLQGACRECMTTPITRTKIYWAAGITLFIVILIIIICVSIPSSENPKGSDALEYVAWGMQYVEPATSEHAAPDTYKTELDKIAKTNVNIQVFCSKTECDSSNKDADSRNMDQLDFLSRALASDQQFSLVTTYIEPSEGKVASVLSVCGGHAISNRLSLLRAYQHLGVRMMSLVTDGCDTNWAKSAGSSSTKTLDTKFRDEVITEMNRLGMIIDISGLDAETQTAVIDKSAAPVVAYGVGLTSVVKNSRNLDDSVLEKMASKNGLVMLSLDCSLITSGANCTMDNFTKLLDAALAKKFWNLGFGGPLSASSKVPSDFKDPGASLKDYFNKLYDSDSKKYSLDFLRGLAVNNFMVTFKTIQSKAVEIQKNTKPSDYRFNFNSLSDKDKSCYTDKTPPPTQTPTPATSSETTPATTPVTTPTTNPTSSEKPTTPKPS